MTQWFRFYGDAINDPKVLKLPEVTRWRWVAVLSAASKHHGRIPAHDDLALMLRITAAETKSLLATLEKANLIDRDTEGFTPHNWNKFQYKSDVSTERVQKHRNKKGNVSETFHVVPDETQPTATVTPPETDTEADTEQKGGGVTREAEEAYLLALGQSSGPDKPPEKKRLISEDAFALAPELLRMIGVEDGHPLSMGAPYSVQTWLNGGWPVEAIKAGIQRAMANKQGDPPSTLKYFEKAIARCYAEMNRPLPVVKLVPQTITETHHGKAQRPGGSLIASIDAELRAIEQEESLAARDEGSVRLISARPVQ
jgi:hypothetical protein